MAENYVAALEDELKHVEQYLAAATKAEAKALEARLDDIKAEIARVAGVSTAAPAETAVATAATETPEAPAV